MRSALAGAKPSPTPRVSIAKQADENRHKSEIKVFAKHVQFIARVTGSVDCADQEQTEQRERRDRDRICQCPRQFFPVAAGDKPEEENQREQYIVERH